MARVPSTPGHRHCRPCRTAPPFAGHFPVPPVVTAFSFRNAWRSRNVLFSCSAPPGLGLRGLAFAVLACFLLVGRVASIHGGFG